MQDLLLETMSHAQSYHPWQMERWQRRHPEHPEPILGIVHPHLLVRTDMEATALVLEEAGDMIVVGEAVCLLGNGEEETYPRADQAEDMVEAEEDVRGDGKRCY